MSSFSLVLRARAAFVACVLVLVVVAPQAVAQQGRPPGVISFDPARDLPGFEEKRASVWRELYPIDAYSKKLGDELDAAGLEHLRAAWTKECAAADEQAAKLRSDPDAAWRWHLERRLAKNGYFGKVALAFEDGGPGWLLVAQSPPKQDAEYVAKLRATYAPWVAKLDELFRARFAEPLSLVRRADAPRIAIAVLASPGDYDNYDQHGAAAEFGTATSAWDAPLGIAVGFNDPFSTPGRVVEPYALARQAVQALLAAYGPGRAEAPGKQLAPWLSEGLASYLARNEKGVASALGAPWISPDTLRFVVEQCQAPATAAALLAPFRDVVAVRTWEDAYKLATERATNARIAGPMPDALGPVFQAEAVLWTHFLVDGGDAELRAAHGRALQLVLAGKTQSDAALEAFGKQRLNEVDARFWKWAYDLAATKCPDVKLDRAAIDALLAAWAREAKPVAGAAAPVPAKSATPPPVAFDPRALALAPGDHAARLGRALVVARAGDLDGARAMLAALLEQKPAEPEAARAKRTIARLDAAILLRAAWLESVRAKGGKLAVARGEKRVSAAIARVDADRVVFADNKVGLAELPLAALDPLDVAKETSSKEQQGAAPAWTRSFLFLLCGDARWERLLKDAGADEQELRADAAWIAGALQTGKLADSLEGLATSKAPASGAEGKALVERVRALLAAGPANELVAARRDPLRALASAALAAQAAELPATTFLHGKSEALGGDRYKVTWGFDSEQELEDVVLMPGHLAWLFDGMTPIDPKTHATRASVERGNLVLTGAGAWRVGLPVTAPFTFEMKVSYVDPAKEPVTSRYFGVSVCDDGARSRVHFELAGTVDVLDGDHNVSIRVPGEGSWIYYMRRDYAWRIDHDGADWHWTIDDKERAKGTAAGLKSGAVVLSTHSEMSVRVDSIVVIGSFDATATADARKRWVATELAGLGLGEAQR